MNKPPEKLVELFRQMGVDEPELWASSEFNEDISQISRATMLRNVADMILEHCNAEKVRATAALSEFGLAAAAAIDTGNTDWESVSEVCRQVLSHFMWSYFRMIDDMDEMPVNPAKLEWQLTSFDEDGRQVGSADALYESLYHMLRHVSGRES